MMPDIITLQIYQMAQNFYIRPLTKNYHDFTQQKFQQTMEETPYKFKGKGDEKYVKKPVREPPPQNLPAPSPRPPIQQPSCCSCLSYCWNSKGSSGSSNSCPICCTYGGDHNRGNCCCQCLEPELCQQCVGKLCNKCVERMCLKLTLCTECSKLLCPKCKKLILSSCCDSSPKLRNYTIRLKNRSTLHFADCKCSECLKFMQDIQKSEVPIANQIEPLAFENLPAQDVKADNPHKMGDPRLQDFQQVDSVVHY